MPYEPELGQMAFSNTPWQEHETPAWMTISVELLGAMLEQLGLSEANPTSNTGAFYENDVFVIRAYCWCDGGPEHENGCPPNFEIKAWPDFRMQWYKHAERGESVNMVPDPREWYMAIVACLQSILGTTQAGA